MRDLASVALGIAVAWVGFSAQAQPYVTGQIGYASADFALDEPYNGVVDDNSALLGITAGFGFGRWAVEGGLLSYAGFDGRATPCPEGDVCSLVVQPVDDNDVTIRHIALVPRITIGDVRLYGKAGYYHARIDTPVLARDADFRKNGLLLAAGVRWYFDEPWSLSLEASRYGDRVRQLTIGVGWGIRPFR